MTQTNNEREALLNKFREIIAEQGWQCRDMTEKLIDAAYAHIQSPISQNEQQEAIYQEFNPLIGCWYDCDKETYENAREGRVVYKAMNNASPTTSLTSETNTEVGE